MPTPAATRKTMSGQDNWTPESQILFKLDLITGSYRSASKNIAEAPLRRVPIAKLQKIVRSTFGRAASIAPILT